MEENALSKVSYGMYIVSSVKDGKYNGQIANTVVQVSAEPPLITVAVNKKNLTHKYISASSVFSVSILSREADMRFIGRFGFRSGRDLDKFEGVDHLVGKTGAPVVTEHALGYLEAEVIDTRDCGTHTLFFGSIKNSIILKSGDPMTYSYYHRVLKGKTQKNAPTYLARTRDEGV